MPGPAFDLVLRRVTIVSASGETLADVGIRQGRIARVGSGLGENARKTIDAEGLHAIPGVVDTQVHFREPGMEHKEDLESGTRAAICGGVTTVFEMPNTSPSTTSAEALADKLRRAKGRAWCDHAFFVGATRENVDELAELEQLPGTPGIKVFMGSSTGSLLVHDATLLRQILSNGQRPVAIHAELESRLRERKYLAVGVAHPSAHPTWRDPECAVLATSRAIELSRETGRPVHVLHISTLEELPLLDEAKRAGVRVTCEVTPQHLLLDSEDYETLGTLVQMNPPVRDRRHREALLEAFREGLFDVCGSDHAPHTLDEKARTYPESPSGMPGVQTLLPLLLDLVLREGLGLPFLVRHLCERPAEIYGLARKGRLEEGFDADLVLLDLGGTTEVSKSWLQSKCGWSPFEGRSLKGRIEHVFLRGATMVREGELVGSQSGRPAEFVWKQGA